jgi:hypothetical protein
VAWRHYRRRVQPLAGLAQFAPLARQAPEVGPGLAGNPCADGCLDLGGLEEEYIFGR